MLNWYIIFISFKFSFDNDLFWKKQRSKKKKTCSYIVCGNSTSNYLRTWIFEGRKTFLCFSPCQLFQEHAINHSIPQNTQFQSFRTHFSQLPTVVYQCWFWRRSNKNRSNIRNCFILHCFNCSELLWLFLRKQIFFLQEFVHFFVSNQNWHCHTTGLVSKYFFRWNF